MSVYGLGHTEREFDGEKYKYFNWSSTKAVAEKNAKFYRKEGFNVRVTKDDGGYYLWRRKK